MYDYYDIKGCFMKDKALPDLIIDGNIDISQALL